MSDQTSGSLHHAPGAVILATSVGAASGARPAAAALACAAAEPDRATLLIDLGRGRPPRPSLVATAAARRLEERLLAHLPEAAVASRGTFCQLTLPPDPGAFDEVSAALPLVRDSVAVVHLLPHLLRPLLDEPRVQATAALLRADPADDRPLVALAASDLIRRGLRVAVLKRPLGWLAARAALLGALPAIGGAIPLRLRQRLLGDEDSRFRRCYDEEDEQDVDQTQDPRRERWRQR